MNESLRKWLGVATEEYGSFESDEERVQTLSSKMFELPANSSLDDICTEISSFLGLIITANTDLSIIIEALIVFAVSDQSPNRGEVVKQILNLSESAQADLMIVIKDKLERHAIEKLDDDDDNDYDAYEASSTENLDSVDLTTKISAQATQSRGICLSCVENEKMIDKHIADIEALKQEFSLSDSKLRSDLTMERNKLFNLDIKLVDVEDQLSMCKKILSDKSSLIEELESNLSKSTTNQDLINSMKDEIDVLKSKADKLDICESHLSILREKYDELVDVKSQLKVESASHSETYNRLLAAEQELDSLKKAKIQLDEKREEYAEAVIRISELTEVLQQKEVEIINMRSLNQGLSGSQQNQIEQSKHLAEELKVSSRYFLNHKLYTLTQSYPYFEGYHRTSSTYGSFRWYWRRDV